MKSRLSSAAALAGAAVLAAITTSPAFAAAAVSQASANALTLSIAGNGNGTGTFTATNDGTHETTTGEDQPPIQVLTGQKLLNVGVLAQEATAKVQDGAGVSYACAGVAGDGGSVAQVGDSNCLTPGQPVGLSIADLDFTNTQLFDPDTAFAPLNQLGDPLVQQVLKPLTDAVRDGLEPLGDTGLGGTVGAVQARCQARPGSASGTANIANGQLTLDVGGKSYVIADLPVNPAPNTKVVTDLDAVIDDVIAGVETDLNNTFDGQLAGLTVITDAIQQQVVDTVVDQISANLQPIEDSLLDITLNEQSTGNGRIAVTALHLELLPAAASQLGAAAVDLKIANVTCGPNARVAAEEKTPKRHPKVPTVVESGLAGDQPQGLDPELVAGLLALAGAAALIGYRRALKH